MSADRKNTSGAKPRLRLSIALADSALTRPLIDGLISPEGLELIPSVLHGSEIFWRQLRFGDFDASEMSLSSLLIASARGYNRGPPFRPSRCGASFIPASWCAATPESAARRSWRAGVVGVPEYQQTSAIWSRGILQDQFGVAPESIDWYMERGLDRSHGHATGFVAPPGVRLHQIASNSDIGQMLLEGSLDASLLYLNEKNLVDRSTVNVEQSRQGAPAVCRPGGRRSPLPSRHRSVPDQSCARGAPVAARAAWMDRAEPAFGVRRGQGGGAQRGGQRDRRLPETGQLSDECAGRAEGRSHALWPPVGRRELETVARYVHQQGLTDSQVRLQ